MMQVGLTEAAKLTDKDSSTITQAVENGSLSAHQDARGSRVFDMSELERVYGPLKTGAQTEHRGAGTDATGTNAILERIQELHEKDVSLLRERIRMLERQLEDLRDERDKAQAGQTTPLITDQSDSAEKQHREQHQTAEAAAAKALLAEAEARQSPSPANRFKIFFKKLFSK